MAEVDPVKNSRSKFALVKFVKNLKLNFSLWA